MRHWNMLNLEGQHFELRRMKLIKNALKKILGEKQYYNWLTLTKIRGGILWHGLLTYQEFRDYTNELKSSGFLTRLFAKRREFLEAKQKFGLAYVFGGMDVEGARNVYAILRKYKPEIIVETGVNNGFSTSFILQALYLNGKGKLYSIDLPSQYFQVQNKDFWDSLGVAVPEPGWIIPAELRQHWNLLIGDSREILPALLQELGQIDVFIHDGLHTYENMMFEFEESYKYLAKNGLIISDDITWNNSLFDFAKKVNWKVVNLGGGVGLIK